MHGSVFRYTCMGELTTFDTLQYWIRSNFVDRINFVSSAAFSKWHGWASKSTMHSIIMDPNILRMHLTNFEQLNSFNFVRSIVCAVIKCNKIVRNRMSAASGKGSRSFEQWDSLSRTVEQSYFHLCRTNHKLRPHNDLMHIEQCFAMPRTHAHMGTAQMNVRAASTNNAAYMQGIVWLLFVHPYFHYVLLACT